MSRPAADILLDLSKKLNEFDWPASDKLADELGVLALREPSVIKLPLAKNSLKILRDRCRFRPMGLLAQAYLQAGLDDAQLKRQMAQALIDQGHFYAAELALNAILASASSSAGEKVEAQGLLGRLYKQLYVTASKSDAPTASAEAFFQKSLDRYWTAYQAAPEVNYWHGINTVALLLRGAHDKLQMPGAADPKVIAAEIRTRLEAVDEPDGYQYATLMQCHVASGDVQAALDAAKSFIAVPGDNAFEIGGTIRQLEEIFQLTEDSDMGKQLLPLLRAEFLKGRDGGMRIQPEEAKSRLENATQSQIDLEAIHGSDSFQSLKWYRDGLERCKSVARITKRGGVGFGTAWLVNASDFFPGETGRLLLTNAHVVGKEGALTAENAQATFHMASDQPIDIESVFRWSPVNRLDAAFLKLKETPANIDPMPLAPKPVVFDKVLPARLYVIGHPNGGDLAFSLQDNRLLGANTVKVHYRTPTTGGSSGSPVFEDTGWQIVALHHGGGTLARLDDDSATYDANEGISIHAIREAAQQGSLQP